MPTRPTESPDLPPLFLSPQTPACPIPGLGPQPLLGLTLLVVEDSRFACDALRLLCQHSGARLRRAETLHAARAHLKVYRPDVVIIDLGLPDGRGEGLIRDLAMQKPRAPVILGSSGDPAGRAAALAAGAAGFLAKPIASLAAFQTAILHHLPDRAAHQRPVAGAEVAAPRADPLALRDDLARAARLIAAGPSPMQRRYLTGFVAGLARSSQDAALEKAATALADGNEGLARLAGLLSRRLHRRSNFFAPDPG
ncbi:MAG: response regulator [Pseudorhodobacter sp.]|nr:response regulator [Pseudorhodobacter sp.]